MCLLLLGMGGTEGGILHFPGVGAGGFWGPRFEKELRRGRDEKHTELSRFWSRLVRARIPPLAGDVIG